MATIGTEMRVFGPPGCGKTTYTARQIYKAAEKYGTQSVFVASFTRTAAEELAGRKLPIDRRQVGTLHKHCYAALNLSRGEIAEGHIDEWNKYAPEYRLSGEDKPDLDEANIEATFMTEADSLFSQYQVLRAKMINRQLWPESIRRFARKWEDWKQANKLMDFTDLIETALHDVDTAPGSPIVGFFDEVQDFTPLELSLVRKWGKQMDYYVLVGDDDQCIYSFKGATPDAFLNPEIPEEYKRVLSQSYRVPRLIQKAAERWIGQVTKREPKEYRPKDVEGSIRFLHDANFKRPESIVREIVKELEKTTCEACNGEGCKHCDYAGGKTYMILASCSYMLEPLKAVLRKEAVPFHNPYRVKRGDWNPIRYGGKGTTAVDRILAYLRPLSDVWGKDARVWTIEDLLKWADPIKKDGVFKRGALKQIEKIKDWEFAKNDIDQIIQVFDCEETFLNASFADLDWYEERLLTSKKKPFQYPLAVARKWGAKILRQRPRVIIGTIHSVKGGQADVVYLFPDLSVSGARQWMTPGDQKDAVIRQFYVGMTRAKEELVVCSRATGYAIDWGKVFRR